MPDKDLTARIARLESLLNSLDPVRATAPVPAAHDRPMLDPAVLDRVAVAAERLRVLAGEVETRARSAGWDVADGLLARVVIDELDAAVRGCRSAADATGVHLDRVERAIEQAARELAR